MFDAQAAAPSGALHWVRVGTMRSPAVQAVGDGLAARGYLLAPDALRRYRVWGGTQAVVSFLGFPLAIVLMFLTDPFDSLPLPFVVFPAIVAGTFVGAVGAAATKRRITATGKQALKQYRLANGHRSDAAHFVATGGTRQLRDHALRDQFAPAARTRTDSGVRPGTGSPSGSDAPFFATPVVWCGGGSGHGGGSGGGSCGGSSCGSSGGSSGSSCGGSSGGSSCGGGSSGGGSSCGSSS